MKKISIFCFILIAQLLVFSCNIFDDNSNSGPHNNVTEQDETEQGQGDDTEVAVSEKKGVKKYDNGNDGSEAFQHILLLNNHHALLGGNSQCLETGYRYEKIWLVEIDANGSVVWEKKYGGSKRDYISSMIQIDDGYLITGWSGSDDGDLPGHFGATDNNDTWIFKIDFSGNIVWSKNYGGSGDDWGEEILEMPDGNILAAFTSRSTDGDITGNHSSENDIVLMKIDPNGNILLIKCIGSSEGEYITSIIQTNDNNYILSGFSYGNDGDVSTLFGESDIWIVKIDPDLNILWEQSYGGPDIDTARQIIQTRDNGFVVVGESKSVSGDFSKNYGDLDSYIMKIDASGSLLWLHSYGGTCQELAESVIETDNGDILACMYTSSSYYDVTDNHGLTDIWLIKLDKSGNYVWDSCYGGSGYDIAEHIIKSSTGKYSLVGSTTSNEGDMPVGNGYAFLMTIDSSGQLCDY